MARLIVVAVVLAAIAGLSAAAEEVRTIEIDIEHSRFMPERIQVEAGEKVRFVIHNGDPIDHEFILGDAAVQRLHEEGTEAHHGTKPGEVSVAAFETAETSYSFEGPGTLIFACHLPTHYDYGMKGLIEIH